jgi:predicted PurR-regulated permease PerM
MESMMSKAKKVNATRRLKLGFSILILIFIFFGLFTIYYTYSISSLTRTINDHSLVVSNAALQSNVSITKIHRNMKDVVLFTSPSDIDRFIKAVDDQEKQVYKYLDIVKHWILGNEGKVLENKARSLFVNWRSIREEVIELVHGGDKKTAAKITIGKSARHVALLEEKCLG